MLPATDRAMAGVDFNPEKYHKSISGRGMKLAGTHADCDMKL